MQLPRNKEIAILKSFGVLELTATEVRERYTKKNKFIWHSTIYDILQRLVKNNWLEKNTENRKVTYNLSIKGIRAFEMVKIIEKIFK